MQKAFVFNGMQFLNALECETALNTREGESFRGNIFPPALFFPFHPLSSLDPMHLPPGSTETFRMRASGCDSRNKKGSSSKPCPLGRLLMGRIHKKQTKECLVPGVLPLSQPFCLGVGNTPTMFGGKFGDEL